MTLILQIADIHFGTENPVALAAFEIAAKEIKASALAVCGDLTQRGKRSEFRDAQAWLDHFEMPKLVVPGNHDTPLLNLVERVVSPFDRHEEFFEDHMKPVLLPGAMMTGLNTARGWQTRRNWAEGSVNLDQLDETIAETTHSIQPDQAGLLVCHHPFLSPPQAPLRTATRRGRRASRRLADSPIDFLLTGHVHAPSVTVIDDDKQSYVAVSAGTLSTRMRSRPASFNLIDVTAGNCAVTIFNLRGDRFEPEAPHPVAPDRSTAEPHVSASL